jgi:hypothetical protein
VGDGDVAQPRRLTRSRAASATGKSQSAPTAAPTRATGRRRATAAGGKASAENSAATDAVGAPSAEHQPPQHLAMQFFDF